VITFFSPESFNELCNQYRALAEIVGRQDSAGKLITQVKNEVSVLNNKVKPFAKPKVFVQVGANPLVTVTKKSFIHDFISFAGGKNIASIDTTGLYSREDVIKKNPDVILIVTMGIAGKKEMGVWRTYRTINAVKNNRIHVVDSNKICSPTPVSFIETLEELINIFHPESIAVEEEK
jgi:ABC-type Fe3+-hydroxamate transport system, periplasmic component